MTMDGLPQSLSTLLPAMARIGGIVSCAPPFAGAAVPRKVRAMLAIALTLGLATAIPATSASTDLAAFTTSIVSEAALGVAIGLAISLLFVAAQWAGSLAATQLGLNLGESFDPSTGSASPLGHAYWLLTVVIFLAVNGHHALVRGIGASFQSLPVSQALGASKLLDMFVGLLGTCTVLAVRLAMPVFITMFIVDLAVGMIGRTVPQMGLMTAGVAVRSIVGLVIVLLSLVLTATLLGGASTGWFASIQGALTGKF